MRSAGRVGVRLPGMAVRKLQIGRALPRCALNEVALGMREALDSQAAAAGVTADAGRAARTITEAISARGAKPTIIPIT